MRRFAITFFLLAVASASCGKGLKNEVRKSVRTFDHASLGDKQVEVKNIKLHGSEAVAEVTVTTGVRLKKKNGKWVVEEIRIGDRRWEKAEHILALLNRQRSAQTRRELQEVSDGIERYRASRGKVPQVTTFRELMDVLSPDFIRRIIRIDAWSNPFSYHPISSDGYDLRSAGPDGAIGTADDLTAGSS